MNREINEDYLQNFQARITNSPRIQENYITEVSEEIEGRVTKKLSEEFNRTENHILGALSRLDSFLQSSQSRARSRTVPETSRNSSRENQGTNEDCSQNDPHPDVGVSLSRSQQELGPETTSYSIRVICGRRTPAEISDHQKLSPEFLVLRLKIIDNEI